MKCERFEELRNELLGDLTQLIATVQTDIMGITVIIHYSGTLMASLAVHDSLRSGLQFHDGEEPAGITYMGILEDPSLCPSRWKQIPGDRLRARSNWKEEMFPVGYFVLLNDGRTALALPGRMDGGKIGWSGNEELIDKVAAILSDIGILHTKTCGQ
jgi:hypothetical protein